VQEAFRIIHDRNPIKLIVADKTKAQDTLMWAENEFGCEVLDRAQTNAEASRDYEALMEAIGVGRHRTRRCVSGGFGTRAIRVCASIA
jgi:hypothetical protein